MAEADLSKIVNLIMENPHIIEEIKKLSNNNSEAAQKEEVMEEPAVAPTSEEREPHTSRQTKRRELLRALKPYVSGERGAAIESMMTITDIIETMSKR